MENGNFCMLSGMDSRLTSSRLESRFIPKATPMSPDMAAENIPISNWSPRRSITLRWLSKFMRMMLSDWSISSRSF